jgi:hypothetical protein
VMEKCDKRGHANVSICCKVVRVVSSHVAAGPPGR